MKCPDCKDGKQFVHLNTTDPRTHGFQWIDCFTCHGTQEVDDEYPARVEAGRKLRSEREARGLSLREEAKRLGISVVELSERERGKAKPAPASGEEKP